MKRGTGYKPDKRDDSDVYALALSGEEALRKTSDLWPHVRRVFDQGATSTCVAQAIVAGIDIRREISSRPRATVSRLFPYYFGRSVFMRMVDMGSRPRDVLYALQRMGSPAESQWPFDPAKVNSRPPAEVRRIAADLHFSYRRCTTVEDVADSLAKGCPVAVGLLIDEAFTRNEGPAIVRSFDQKRIGGHMMLIIGNSPDLGAFRVLNSWGTEWRTGGSCFLSHELVKKEAVDLWAIV